MKSLFSEETHNEIKIRLGNLHGDDVAQWGKMSVAQMLHHCQYPINIILEKDNYNIKSNWFVTLFFKSAMYNDKPWRRNLPTVPAFKIKDDKDFTSEKSKLEDLIDELHDNRNQDNWPRHPAFGDFTKEQWGKMQYKHLDHHFRQFGV